MEKFVINRMLEVWKITNDVKETTGFTEKAVFKSYIKESNGKTEWENYILSGIEDGSFLIKAFDTKASAEAAIPSARMILNLKANNLENELFETIEILKTKYVAFSNYLELEELKVRLQTIENKVNATTLPIPTTDFDGADLIAVKTFLTELETFQLHLFDGVKEKMEDFGGSIVWSLDPADPTKIKEIEIHNLGDSVSQIKIEDLNLTIIKHISDSILAVEKKIDDALGITLTSKLVQLGQAINIVVEDEPEDAEETTITVEEVK